MMWPFSDNNECLMRTHNCHDVAECTNNNGSFYCNCNPGFTGNGTYCQGTRNIATFCAMSSPLIFFTLFLTTVSWTFVNSLKLWVFFWNSATKLTPWCQFWSPTDPTERFFPTNLKAIDLNETRRITQAIWSQNLHFVSWFTRAFITINFSLAVLQAPTICLLFHSLLKTGTSA